MTKKSYDWENGAILEDHTRMKHAVLKNYLHEYLITRCKIPYQERFHLVVVDGFAGAGIYGDGSYGSPMIFVEEISNATREINARRAIEGLKPVAVECLLLLNDSAEKVGRQLKTNVDSLIEKTKYDTPLLNIRPEYHFSKFEDLYPTLVKRISSARCQNVIFNLDQCGYSAVTSEVISDIVSRYRSAEVILTFAIESFLTFLSIRKASRNFAFDSNLSTMFDALLSDSHHLLVKQEWLGVAEQIVHAHFRRCAPYVSPFSINNPHGWRYWLMHFANSHRARQVYNDVLHKQSAVQAHYGRAGLNMLSYNPNDEGQLYLFDTSSRESTKRALIEEVPSLVAEYGDAMTMADFYANAYSATPAHTDDIHEVMIANPDIEVITEAGGKRRRPGTIRATDTLRLKKQRSFFSMFTKDTP